MGNKAKRVVAYAAFGFIVMAASQVGLVVFNMIDDAKLSIKKIN